MPNGLLLMMTDIDPANEADFNRWYEEEHLDERMEIPGFINARRFTALEGGPKYLALYDLEFPRGAAVPAVPAHRRGRKVGVDEADGNAVHQLPPQCVCGLERAEAVSLLFFPLRETGRGCIAKQSLRVLGVRTPGALRRAVAKQGRVGACSLPLIRLRSRVATFSPLCGGKESSRPTSATSASPWRDRSGRP